MNITQWVGCLFGYHSPLVLVDPDCDASTEYYKCKSCGYCYPSSRQRGRGI